MTNRTILIGTILSGVVIAGAVIAVACSSAGKSDIDLASTHTTAAPTDPSPSSAAPASSLATTVDETTPETDAPAQSDTANISYGIATYTADNISIRYPVLSHMDDEKKQEEVNQHLKDNALSILKAWDVDSGDCTIMIDCKVPSLNRKRVTAIYTGNAENKKAAHPVSLFYTNTVDLASVKDLGLSDFTDPLAMAGYVLSDDVQLDGPNGDVTKEDLRLMDLDYYTGIFQEADFPFDAAATWPSTFSYEQQGVIYFSVPVSHAVGDYVIVKFTPETK